MNEPQSLFFVCPDTSPAHRIHGLYWPARAASALPPVICVHGLTRNATDFEDIAPVLAATRDVVALSMPGRGLSDWLPDPLYYNYPHYVQDCLHILQHELKFAKVDWLGTSMGGLIGMMMASDAALGAGLVRRLVLNDIGPFLPYSAVQRIALYAGRAVSFASMADAERHCRAIYADFGIKGDAAWKRFAQNSVRALPEGGYTLHYDTAIAKVFAEVKGDVDAWPIYDAVQCPTLLLRGARSDVLSVEVANAMGQRGPKARLVTFEGCGHAPALQDAQQIAAVEAFFSG